MIKNNFKTAFRNIMRNKGFTILNLVGLTIGICACMVIVQHVLYELSYDDFHKKGGSIYRVRLDSYQNGEFAWKSATSFPGIGPAMKSDFPEVENFGRLIEADGVLSFDNKFYKEEKAFFADSSILSMFSFDFVKGEGKSALDKPNSIVISESTARKYFGSEDPIGKFLKLDLDYDLLITGVFKDYPENSHLKIDQLISYSSFANLVGPSARTSWGWYDFYNYIQVRPGTDIKALEAKSWGLFEKYNGESQRRRNVKYEIYLQPLQDIHLYSDLNQEAEPNGNGQQVYFLLLIGFIVLAIAWVNYINLATAKSVERAKEVGVRKVLGAYKKQLIFQFITESFLLNLIAIAFAALVLFLIIPFYKEFTGNPFRWGFALSTEFWATAGFVIIAGAILSGLYPAFIISGFKPISVIKGKFKASSSGIFLRKSLVTVQFAASIMLIAGTIIVYQQIRYMQNQKLGVNIDQTLVIRGAGVVQNDSVNNLRADVFRNLVKQNPAVQSITLATNVPGNEIYWTNASRKLGMDAKMTNTVYIAGVDYQYFKAFDISFVFGREFSPEFPTDKKAVILNETAYNLLKFTPEELESNGKMIIGRDTLTVIGVVKDYHQMGLRTAVNPIAFRYIPASRSFYSVKIKSDKMESVVADMNEKFSSVFPGNPFEYFFLDDFFNKQYKSEQNFGKAFGLFSMLAIVVACLGLFGLSSYSVAQRSKEIGIRKVLGSSIPQIVRLLSTDFVKLLLLANIVAIPATWYLMNNWLDDFAYRTAIHWSVFLIAGVTALVIAGIIIVKHTFTAATANPVNALRSE
jgi:putative ABC transport system permease protein